MSSLVVMSKEIVPHKWCRDIELKIPMSCILIKQIKSLSFITLLGKDTRFDLFSCTVVLHLHIVTSTYYLNLYRALNWFQRVPNFNLLDNKIQNCNHTFLENNLTSSLKFIVPFRCIIMKMRVVNCEMKSTSMLNIRRYIKNISAFHFFDNSVAKCFSFQ